MSEPTTQRYSYDDQDLGVELGDHKSDNDATALPGYPLDVRLQHNWPGLGNGGADRYLDPAGAHGVASWLDEQAAVLYGLPATLRSGAMGARFGPDTWLEANQLAQAQREVCQAVENFVSVTVSNLHAAANSIRQAVTTWQTTDGANSAAAGSVDSGVPNLTTGTGGGPHS